MQVAWIEAGILAAGRTPRGQSDIAELYNLGIRAILTLTESPLTHRWEITPELLAASDIRNFHFPIADQHPPEAERVPDALAFIDQMQVEGRPLYIHCYAGIGRTGTMLHINYLAHGLTLDEVKKKIRTAKLNSQFDLLTDAQQAFLEAYANACQNGK